MQHKSKSPFAAAKWILGVGLLLLVGVIAFTSFGDKRKSESADASSSGTEGPERSAAQPTQRGIGEEVPPWVAVQQKQRALPPGVVPASEINPPPPDPNAPLPPPPVEPPNPATHRP